MAKVESVKWKGREAARLSNEAIEVIALTGGGHLASIRMLGHSRVPPINVLWESPWPTIEPAQSFAESVSSLYGGEDERKLLASYSGHALCLDYFGEPSPEQRAAGLGLHGEAAVMRWNRRPAEQDQRAGCIWDVDLPFARLAFEREIYLADGAPVAYVRETVSNHNDRAHAFDWVQHATFGPPLLEAGESTLTASASRGVTAPSGYVDCSMLGKDLEFVWPFAPASAGQTDVDLRVPFACAGKGFIAGVQLDPQRELEYLIAVNWKLRLGVGYLFRRRDFPWMTLWEENRCRQETPWNGITKARGMEFGTCPLPLGRRETVRRGPIFDTPHQCVLAAGEGKTARYIIWLFPVADAISSVEEARVAGNSIVLFDRSRTEVLSIPAKGCEAYLSRD